MPPLLSKIRYAFTACSLAAWATAVSQAQTGPGVPVNVDAGAVVTAQSADGIRPSHLWTADYLELLWGDTGAVVSAPERWDQDDWMYAGFAAAGIGAAASLDGTIKDRVQANRTAGEDNFFKQYQNLGSTWSFGIIGAFEVWGEVAGDTTAKNTAMDALAASIIGPGLIGTSVKYAVGRERPSTTARTFKFRPFSGNQAFPSGHAAQAFAVATAIAESYPTWWVQTLCYGGAGLVGYARIEQDAHYTSDVVAGSLLGWAVARAVVHRHEGPPSPKKLSWSPYANGNGAGVVFFKSF
jgi:hypothetical protein